MKPKIGIDIVENQRLKFEPNFVKKILSPTELDVWQNLPTAERKREFLAGRWAVKEAIYKVTDQEKWVAMNKIEITCGDHVPTITNPQWENLALSISHEKNYSVAVALNWGE